MKENRFYIPAAGALVCLSLLFSCDAQQLAENTDMQPVKLALKFEKGLSENYTLQTVSQRKVSVQGRQAGNTPGLSGGQTTSRIEVVFNQSIENIDDAGNAIEKITIKELKYFEEVRSATELDFDSTKNKDPNDALAALIGKGYTIEVTPSGRVSRVVDVNEAREAIKNKASNKQAAIGLLSDATIVRQHSVPLPGVNNSELSIGGTWSNVVTFDFGLMGTRSYTRTYKLEKIEKNNGSLNATIDMNGIPSAESGRQAYREQGAAPIPPMTDVRLTYTGGMNFNATGGTLVKYQEDLTNEWLIVPGSNSAGPPIALSMVAVQSYNLEKIDQ